MRIAPDHDWPFDVFQLDDGYQAGIGDWLATNDTFPSDLDAIAAAIRAAGPHPGDLARPVPRRRGLGPARASPRLGRSVPCRR